MADKKGQGLVEVFSWFLILVFTIIFFILFQLPGCSGDTPSQKIEPKHLGGVQDEFNLVSFLRTPVTVDGAELTMSELIILAKENRQQYRDKFKEKAAEVMIDLRSGCSAVKIRGIAIFFGDCESSSAVTCGNQTQVIPYPEGNFSIQLCARDYSFWRGWVWQTKEYNEFGIQQTG